LQIFSQTTVTALREFGPKVSITNIENTALYIEIINRWWDIVNVKTMFKGKRLLNKFQEPVTRNFSHIIEFLEQFVKWLNNWQHICHDGKLTKETHLAVAHTTDAYLKIIKYLLYEKNFNFVLLGKIQTDRLNEKFGKYRYLASSQYHVSLGQVYESECKLRLMSVMPLTLKSKNGDIKISKDDIVSFIATDNYPDNENIVIPSSLRRAVCLVNENALKDVSENTWPSLIFISGYCSYSLLKRIKCDYCKVFLTDSNQESSTHTGLITANDRGGLCYPSENVSTGVREFVEG
jgi:hypothetical protein